DGFIPSTFGSFGLPPLVNAVESGTPTAGPGTVRRRGLVRFQPIVATAPSRGSAALPIIAAIGLLAGLAAAAPAVVRRFRRPSAA
ncbi:MAG: hypothetical protein RL531_1495, partial [Actinomycetota bacterium]